MKKNASTPWSYRKGNSVLHRLPPLVKLAFLLVLSFAAFFPNLYVLSSIVLVLIILSVIAGIGPAALLRGSGPLLLIVLAAFVVEALEFNPPRLDMDDLDETLVFCVRLGAAFAAGTLLFAVTTTGEIRKSLLQAERFLHIEKLKPALAVSLMLGFLKAFFEIWEDLTLAWKSRGGKNNLRRLRVLVPLLVERMMTLAAETAEAMESRGALL